MYQGYKATLWPSLLLKILNLTRFHPPALPPPVVLPCDCAAQCQFPLAGTQLCPRPARVSRCIVGSTTTTVSTPVNSSNVYYSSSDEDKEDGLSMTSTSTTRSGDEDEEEEVEGTTEKIWTLVEQAQEARQGILRDQAERVRRCIMSRVWY